MSIRIFEAWVYDEPVATVFAKHLPIVFVISKTILLIAGAAAFLTNYPNNLASQTD